MTSQPRFDDLPDILTVEEAAAYLRVGRATLYDALRRGEIRSVRIGRRILIPRLALPRPLDTAIGEEGESERIYRKAG